jgi:hypothetical protein
MFKKGVSLKAVELYPPSRSRVATKKFEGIIRPFHPTAAEGKGAAAAAGGMGNETVSGDKDYIEQKAPIFEKSASTSQREKLHREARSRVTSELSPRGGERTRRRRRRRGGGGGGPPAGGGGRGGTRGLRRVGRVVGR